VRQSLAFDRRGSKHSNPHQLEKHPLNDLFTPMIRTTLKTWLKSATITRQEKKMIENWERDGFIILKNFFDQTDLSLFEQDLNFRLANRATAAGNITIDVLEGEFIGQRLKLAEAPASTLNVAYKLNDLYLESNACRTLNLNQKLCRILALLLDDEPLVINSLSFQKGSQQPHHFDTYYMPPIAKDMMAVTSICLEDQSVETGPLSYYPKSHKIPPYVFSHGGIHAIPEEMEQAKQYIQSELEERHLQPETFIGKAGDVFIWHAQLYHGGLPILNHEVTRKTLVTHYWRKHDVEPQQVATIASGGSYLIREHQNVR
jgi:ectoine hydroxylase-related dioxygenase (phytanoyl-CoA dioxygenase family)